MTRPLHLALIAALAPACTAIFPASDAHDSGPAPRDAAVDAPAPDAGDASSEDGGLDGGADAGCPLQSLSRTPEADVGITAGHVEGNYGGNPIINIGVARALLRFDLDGLPPDAGVREMRLSLTRAEQSDGCGAPCADCTGIERDGDLDVYFMRSDWEESQATWLEARTGDRWVNDGASAGRSGNSGGDRSSTAVATMRHSAGTSTSFVIRGQGLAELPDWRERDGQKLSLQVASRGAAVMIMATKESGVEGCNGGAPFEAPRLEIDWCDSE